MPTLAVNLSVNLNMELLYADNTIASPLPFTILCIGLFCPKFGDKLKSKSYNNPVIVIPERLVCRELYFLLK